MNTDVYRRQFSLTPNLKLKGGKNQEVFKKLSDGLPRDFTTRDTNQPRPLSALTATSPQETASIRSSLMKNGKERAKPAEAVTEYDESEFETQGFEPREDDSDQLWDVETILNEKNGGRYFLVRWLGTDENGKRWEDSWVPREDVTDDLVQEWKKKKAAKKAEKGRRRKEQRQAKAKASSAGNATPVTKQGRTPATLHGPRTVVRGDSTPTGAPSRAITRRRKRSETSAVSSDQELAAVHIAPRKKRKVTDAESVVSTVDALSDVFDRIPSPLRPRTNGRRAVTASASAASSSAPHNVSTKVQWARDVRRDGTKQGDNNLKSEEEEEEEEEDQFEEAGREAEKDSMRVSWKRKGKEKAAEEEEQEEEEEEEEEDVMSSLLPYQFNRRDTKRSSKAQKMGATNRRRTSNKAIAAAGEPMKSVAPSKVVSPEFDTSSSIGGANVASISPSRWRDGGLVSRMKAKGTGSSPSKTANTPVKERPPWSRSSSPQLEDRQMRARRSPPKAMLDSVVDGEDEPPDFSPMQDADDIGVPFEYDNCDAGDNEIGGPDDGMVEKSAGENSSESAITRKRKKGRPAAEMIRVEGAGDEISPANDALLSSSSLVIPETQSQTQNRSLSQVVDAGEPDSLLVEHGSSAPPRQDDLVNTGDELSLAEKNSFQDTTMSSPSRSLKSSAAGKRLGPIPKVTPSKFRPHLPVLRRLSSLPRLDFGPKEPSSSIDTASPAKKARSTTPVKPRGSTRNEEEDEIDDSLPVSLELRQRGSELHEKHRRDVDSLRKAQSLPKISVDEIISSRANSQVQEHMNLPLFLEDAVGVNQEPQAITHSGILPISMGITDCTDQPDEEQEAMIRQFEQEYIDFDGNAGPSVGPISSLTSPGPTSPKDEEEEVRAMTEEPIDEDNVIAPLPQGALADGGLDINDDDPFIADYASRERTPTTTTSQQAVEVAGFRILGTPRTDFTNMVETPVKQLNSALALLNRKSEEIAFLKASAAEYEKARLDVYDRIASLQTENEGMKKAMADQSLTNEIKAVYEDKLKALTEAFDAMVIERDSLVAEVSLLKGARDDAVKDADLFRELYGKASSFVDETKKENVTLAERIVLLESQLKNGLRLIRSQNEAQVSKLTDELERCHLQLRVLKDKDQRTDDTVRRRAAREAELQPRITELLEEIDETRQEVSAVVRNRNQLLVRNREIEEDLEKARSQAAAAHEENLGLRIEIARYVARERLTIKTFKQTSNGLEDGDSDSQVSSDSEEVFVCSWVTEGDEKQCGKHFASKMDLQDHLFLEGHL